MRADQTQLEEIFLAALELPDATRCREFLDRQCAGSPALRGEVEQLLAVQAEAERFFAETHLQLNDAAVGPSENRD